MCRSSGAEGVGVQRVGVVLTLWMLWTGVHWQLKGAQGRFRWGWVGVAQGRQAAGAVGHTVGVGGADAVDVMAGLLWELKAPEVY